MLSLIDDEVSLYVEGKKFTSWKSVSISRAIDAAAGSFSLSAIEENSSILSDYELKPGAECRVSIGGDTVITGYIDDVKMSIDSGSFSLSVSGRDKTADLIDCSATGKSEFNNKTLTAIAQELCSPFGIAVLTDDGQDKQMSVRLNPKAAKSIAQSARRRKKKSSKFAGEVKKKFRTQPGETVIECLERVAKEKGLLISSTANGELLLTRSNKEPSGATIVEGENLLSASIDTSIKDRFSKYIVNGQESGAVAASNRWRAFKYETSDLSIERYRPLVILAENAMGITGARRRAAWEATVRAAKSTSISAEVAEWRSDVGKLWTPNTIVRLKCPSLRVDRELLITEVNFEMSDSGRTTSLTLKRPDAFLLETDIVLPNNDPIKPKKIVKLPSKRKSIKPIRRTKRTPKPVSRSRGLVLNTATTSGTETA